METKRYYWQEGMDFRVQLQEAVDLLGKGEVVAFPTETVYGLGADARNEEACRKIFLAKGRPGDNPLIVHIGEIGQIADVCRDWPEQAVLCAEHFWPGPLTMVVKKAPGIPVAVTGGLDTVGVRMPDHPLALALLRTAGCPIAAPSANISGKPSPTAGEHVWRDLAGKIPLLIDAGRCRVGLESTVLDLTGETPCILRPGGVTREQLQDVLGRVENDPALFLTDQATQPKAPGMKYRHYAPEGRIVYLGGDIQSAAEEVTAYLSRQIEDELVGLLLMEDLLSGLPDELLSKAAVVFSLGDPERPEEGACRLFEGLRLCDQYRAGVIFIQGMAETGIGTAFMNRLKKAVGSSKRGSCF